MGPKVSVIMGVFNCETTIDEAIMSIVNQTYGNWELIICDDASTDNTLNIIKKYKDSYPEKIIILKNQSNMKLAYTLNRCLKHATGDYIARMDGDDISISDRFEEQVSFLESNLKFDLVGSQMISFDEKGVVGVKSSIPSPNKYSLRKRPPFFHATIMARKNVFDSLNGYKVSERVRRCEDVDLWFRFYDNGFEGYNLNKPLYKVREDCNAFKRRSFSHGVDAMLISYVGFRSLKYPKRYYIYLLKPILSSIIPSKLMMYYHKVADKL